jgi:hypothetical protein
MFRCYRDILRDHAVVANAPTPTGIRDLLELDTGWFPGSYEVIQDDAPLDYTGRRWGVAIKHPDGRVEVIQDPPD